MGETFQNFLLFVEVVILTSLILTTVFVLQNNLAIKNKNNATIIATNNIQQQITQENEDKFSTIQETHWDHMPLTYDINPNCSERQANLVVLAFQKMKEETDNMVYFEKSIKNPDYTILCKSQETSKGTDLTLADATYQTDPYNNTIIIHAEINFYGQGLVCGTKYPALEIHEILHTFDFGHNPLTSSILNPYAAESTKDCKIIKMDNEYSECLKYIYSNGLIGTGCNIENRYIEEDNKPECDNGYYDVPGTAFCCPEENMSVRDGFCYN